MNILHIDCSPRPHSQSRLLSAAIIDRIRSLRRVASITRRDLGTEAMSHHTPEYADAIASPAGLMASVGTDVMSASDLLIQELELCDALVIGTPMNNFTIPSNLKAWIDQIVRMGRTIVPSPTGKQGLLKDRPVFVGIASGSIFSGEGANQPDFLTPYLSAALGCTGLKSVYYFSVQGTARLDDDGLHSARQAAVAGLTESCLGAL
jgi:FMN-dependent NADH-azoreductase